MMQHFLSDPVLSKSPILFREVLNPIQKQAMDIDKKHHLLLDCSYIRDIPSNTESLHIYAGRLLQGLRLSTIFDVTALVCKGMENYIDSLAGYCVDKIVVDIQDTVTHSIALDRLLALIPFEQELRARSIDVVVTPCHVLGRYFFPKRYRHYSVVHDLIYLQRRKENTSKWRYACVSLWRKILFRRVRFISISEETRRALLKCTKRDSAVLYNSIPFDFQQQEKPVESVCGRKYILDVNRFELYKNAETLIRALYELKDQIPHILYLKGYDSRYSDIEYLQRVVSKLKMDHRVVFDSSNRSEGEMRWLYTHADLFVTPSLKEGFGWTPIEAAVLKTPVLISNIDVLKEVTCGKIPTFDPYSVEDLAKKMLSTLETPPSMEERVALSAFYQEKYSLKKQIDGLTEIVLSHIM
ncbi:MAG: glycosyltransferase [Prevotella sp.]|nr:glycosyltransferase [Prevotella sp.]MBQ3700009.1 glycosyltransferase [Prevotella sp.]